MALPSAIRPSCGASAGRVRRLLAISNSRCTGRIYFESRLACIFLLCWLIAPSLAGLRSE
jgi:hypothetical protein